MPARRAADGPPEGRPEGWPGQRTATERSTAFMVVRAWRDGPGPGGVRARIWRAAGVDAELDLGERMTASMEELERSVRDWLEVLHEDDWSGEWTWRSTR